MQPCLTPLLNEKRDQTSPSKPISMKGYDYVGRFIGHSIPLKTQKSPSPLIRPNASVRSIKGMYSGHFLFLTFFLNLPGCKDYVNCRPLSLDTALCLWIDSRCKKLKFGQSNFCQDIANYAEQGNSSVAVALSPLFLLYRSINLASRLSCGTSPILQQLRSSSSGSIKTSLHRLITSGRMLSWPGILSQFRESITLSISLTW